eukprot:TRINITY_DN10222_c0_g1_i1.p1 TRINITY_DN10222_c0_g1~~TRINITY_DN10222_c0_g1_i1.p1  ORF type:complete len:401 (+),score=16.43 TRINITY_DN10222_c0_g1_i1:43-1245(+)
MWYASDIPWLPIRMIPDIIDQQPTLLIGELLFITLAVVTLIHALHNGTSHFLVWITTIAAGTANDIFFMVLPVVDNFWHAQCTLNLTGRLPLYIVCVYISFMYIPTVALWRTNLPPFARFSVSALLAGWFYAGFDLFGAKFVWWSWHDTDASIRARWLGVPYGSTLWTVVFTFCFCMILHFVSLKHSQLGFQRFGAGLLLTSLLATPLMMIFMSMVQFTKLALVYGLDNYLLISEYPRVPDQTSLLITIFILIIMVIYGCKNLRIKPFAHDYTSDRVLFIFIAIYFATFLTLMIVSSPEEAISIGVHQEIGECYVEDWDLFNISRYKYLCPSDYDEDFRICTYDQDYWEVDMDMPTWYTICGLPHSNYTKWVTAETIICVGGAIVFYYLLCTSNKKIKNE